MTEGEPADANSNGDNSAEESTYVVVMRAPAGFYFGRNDPLPTMRFLTEIGPAELTFGTVRILPPGFRNPIRHGLWAEGRGNAPSLDASIDPFANAARGVAAALSVAANAPTGNLTADLAFDATPGRWERDYWRRNLPDDPIMPAGGRRLDAALALALVGAWMRQPVRELDRWLRIFVSYHHALQEWDPGMEIPALSHLWAGMEALTPIARRRHLEAENLSREELVAQWGIELEELDAQVRLRLLFQGDEQCYGDARRARNAHQHGFRPLWDVRRRALDGRDCTAGYLRSAVVGLVGLGAEERAALLAPPYDRPFHWSLLTSLHGRLVGNLEDPSRPEDAYPRVDWRLVPTERVADAEGDAQIGFTATIEPYLAGDMSFEFDRVEIWGPPSDHVIDAPARDEGGAATGTELAEQGLDEDARPW